MYEVNSMTKDADIDVIYGMMNLREERELARASVKYILTDMSDIRRSFIRLGFHLYEFERMCYYEDFGYTSIAEFAEKNLGLSKTQVSVYKNIYLEFGFYDEHSSVPKMWLDDKYKQYSYSQLREMLPMSEEKRKQVKPDMTIEQIREIKKPKANVAISQLEEKTFDYDKCMVLTGAARQKYISSRDPKESVVIHLFNKDGSEIKISGLTNVWIDLLQNKQGHVYIRLNSNELKERFSGILNQEVNKKNTLPSGT